MKKIGLYFGTFNPIHIGHLVIANHIAEFSDLDEVWLVVTPHNPHKIKKNLLNDNHRYQMVAIAIEGYPKLKASKIEFGLPQPNYTVNTLAHLTEKHPNFKFCLIMGADNLQSLHKWKNYQVILNHHEIYVYPRVFNGTKKSKFDTNKKIHTLDAPIIEVSSTFIREAIKNKKNIKPLLPNRVWLYLDEMNFYR
ncbi:MAG: nicotinate-nucleotide adenylyltransferase [Flavobacteriaceae bacterium]|nr:nicotinate-nucleotide adenylyltransferase [Flavobacteriaceae bacterium]